MIFENINYFKIENRKKTERIGKLKKYEKLILRSYKNNNRKGPVFKVCCKQ